MESAAVLASQATLALENSRLMGELRRRVTDLEAAQSRLAHTERLAGIGQLAAGVAHEINNPVSFLLTSIEHIEESVGYLEGAAEYFEKEPMRGALSSWLDGTSAKVELGELMQSVRDGKEGAERIRDIAKDLRLLSRKDAPDMVRIDLNESIRGAMRVARLSMGKNVELRSHLLPGVWVMALERRLSQVFVNLLVNAAQAVSQEGASERWVDVRTVIRDGWVVASVSDCGSGIPPEFMRRIFEPFFTTKPGESGTGLGLSISREIVEKHGGLISVDSTIGRGTTFEIKLPLDRSL
jgi:signal transduction histidine kinase